MRNASTGALLSALLLLGFAGALPAMAEDEPLDPGAATAPASTTETGPKVQVNDFKVTGNTLLSDEELNAVLSTYKGQSLTLQGLRGVADKLTEAYNNKGYFTVRALLPEQNVAGGRVELNVLQNKLGKFSVDGDSAYSNEFIKWYFEPVLEQDYPTREQVERSVLLLNEFTGLKASTVLEAGSKPGTVDLTVSTSDNKATRFNIDYNNYGSRAVGFDRPGAGLEFGNLSGNGDSLVMRGLTTIASRGTTLGTFSYNIPLDNEGTKLSAMYSNAAFGVGGNLQILDIRGDANVYGAFVSHPFIRSARQNLDVQAGLMFQDINNSILGQTFARDRLRELILGMSTDWTDDTGRNFFSARMTQDLGTGLGGLVANEPLSSRQAGGGFNKWNLTFARVHRLDDQFFAVLQGQHQFAFAPLPTAEQFSLTGPVTVRGYRQAGYLGDGGFTVGAEFRYAPIIDDLEALQFAAFIDHGNAYLRRPAPGEIPNVSATGAGIGVRFRLWEGMSMRADLAWPVGTNALTTLGGSDPVPYLYFLQNF